jgi:hypothetical protein
MSAAGARAHKQWKFGQVRAALCCAQRPHPFALGSRPGARAADEMARDAAALLSHPLPTRRSAPLQCFGEKDNDEEFADADILSAVRCV